MLVVKHKGKGGELSHFRPMPTCTTDEEVVYSRDVGGYNI